MQDVQRSLFLCCVQSWMYRTVRFHKETLYVSAQGRLCFPVLDLRFWVLVFMSEASVMV